MTERTKRISISIADLQSIGERGVAGLLPSQSQAGCAFLDPGDQLPAKTPRYGTQHVVNLASDLVLSRSNLHAVPRASADNEIWEFDSRGWLLMHFRLDGLSREYTPDGRRSNLGADSFFLSLSSRSPSFAREVLGDTWRTVGIACRPSFLMQSLALPADRLPTELYRFRAGDPDVDFSYMGGLTTEMKSVAGALLNPSVHATIRPIYLRAKVVELACLALDRMRTAAEADGEGMIALSARNVASLHAARRLLQQCDTLPSLAELGRQVGLNRSKLAFGFRHAFGTSIGTYHRELRLERARKMLERANTTIGCAASAAGYADMGSFTKAFKQLYGSLPSEVRSGRPRGRKKVR